MHLIFLFLQLYFLPIVVFSCAANSFIMVGLLLALLQVMWPTLIVEDKPGRTSTMLLCLPYAQFPLVWQSWIKPGQAIRHYACCWAAWNRLKCSWVPIFQVLALWSSVLWLQIIHLHFLPAMHHMLNWLHLEWSDPGKWWEKNEKSMEHIHWVGLSML